MFMRTLLKRSLPEPARRTIKLKLWDLSLRKAIEPLRRTGNFTGPELNAFWQAWGNQGFSADKRYLQETIRLIEENRGAVLECGTGATTVIAGVLAERYGFHVYSLEQDPAWSSKASRAIVRNGLNRVHIIDAPLKRFGDCMWYDPGKASVPDRIGLIICDGPYIAQELGEPVYSSWRYGVLRYLLDNKIEFGALLLDDVNDPRAPAVLSRWKREFGITYELIHTDEGDCSVVRIPSR